MNNEEIKEFPVQTTFNEDDISIIVEGDDNDGNQNN